MSARKSYFCSTIGRKQIVGLTGLSLSLFVLTHVLGNFLIFVGPEAYNMYSHALISNPLIYFAEGGLILLFLAHMGFASRLFFENRGARPQSYAVSASGDKGTSAVTKTMWHQGIIILVFVVLHLITFKFGNLYTVEYEGLEVRDLYRLIIEVFQSPVYVLSYIVALVVLGFHLSHGVSSAIQTFGFHHPKHTCKVELIGKIFALFVALGFISQPLYVFFLHNG